MLVRWLLLRKKALLREKDYGDSDLDAIAAFIEQLNDPFVERVELICDKGEGADAREGAIFHSSRELRDWYNDPERVGAWKGEKL